MNTALPPDEKAIAARHGEPIANWCKLSKDDRVDIYNARGSRTTGRIDMVAGDGSILWIIQDEGRGRALFVHEDGVKIRRRQ